MPLPLPFLCPCWGLPSHLPSPLHLTFALGVCPCPPFALAFVLALRFALACSLCPHPAPVRRPDLTTPNRMYRSATHPPLRVAFIACSTKIPIKSALLSLQIPQNPKKPAKNLWKPQQNPLTLPSERLIVNCGTFPRTRINTGEIAPRTSPRTGHRGKQEADYRQHTHHAALIRIKEQHTWQKV